MSRFPWAGLAVLHSLFALPPPPPPFLLPLLLLSVATALPEALFPSPPRLFFQHLQSSSSEAAFSESPVSYLNEMGIPMTERESQLWDERRMESVRLWD